MRSLRFFGQAAQNTTDAHGREFDEIRDIRVKPATLSPTTALSAIGTSSVAELIRLADGTANSPFSGAKSDTRCAAKHLTVGKFQFQSLPRVLTVRRPYWGQNSRMTTGSGVNSSYARGWSVDGAGNWDHNGALPGTLSLLRRRASGTGHAALINTRQAPPAQQGMINAFYTLMDDVEAALGSLPEVDLF